VYVHVFERERQRELKQYYHNL